MVKGPAARCKRVLDESKPSISESEIQSSESNKRNLFRVAGALFQRETGCLRLNAVAESICQTSESKIPKSESNIRNLFQVTGRARCLADNPKSVGSNRHRFSNGNAVPVIEDVDYRLPIQRLLFKQNRRQPIKLIPASGEQIHRLRQRLLKPSMYASGQIRMRIKDWSRILVVAVKERLHRPKTETALHRQGKPGRTGEVTVF
jgi:hypothetical protein